MLTLNSSAEKRLVVIFPCLRLPSQLSYADLMSPTPLPLPLCLRKTTGFLFSRLAARMCQNVYFCDEDTVCCMWCSHLDSWGVCVFKERTRGRKFNFHSLSSVGDYTESLADFAPSLALTKYLQCIIRHALHPAFPFFFRARFRTI